MLKKKLSPVGKLFTSHPVIVRLLGLGVLVGITVVIGWKSQNQWLPNLIQLWWRLTGQPTAKQLQPTLTAEPVIFTKIDSGCDEQLTLTQAKACTWLVETDLGHGSAVAIAPHYLVTNKHVVAEAREVEIKKGDQSFAAKLWNYDQQIDLAILKVSAGELATCGWADPTEIKLAETLYAIGWPNSAGGESSITRGIFSRLVTDSQGITLIQTDAAINPGNSGGPLINQCGVVGINTAKITWSETNVPAEGFSFALAASEIATRAAQLINTGSDHDWPVAGLEITNPLDIGETPRPTINQTNQYQLTTESRASWIKAIELTQELNNYWTTAVGNYQPDQLAALKDLIARMLAVVNNVGPKIEQNQSLTPEEIKLLQAWEEMYQKAVALEGNLDGHDYQSGYQHTICQNQACVSVAGRGQNQCQSSADCQPTYHYECRNLACTLVEGSGDHDCSSHDDCYYYQCQNNGCTKVAGEGTDECYFDWQCQ